MKILGGLVFASPLFICSFIILEIFLTFETFVNVVPLENKERLSAPIIKPGIELHQMQRENLCIKRLKEAQENKTPP